MTTTVQATQLSLLAHPDFPQALERAESQWRSDGFVSGSLQQVALTATSFLPPGQYALVACQTGDHCAVKLLNRLLLRELVISRGMPAALVDPEERGKQDLRVYQAMCHAQGCPQPNKIDWAMCQKWQVDLMRGKLPHADRMASLNALLQQPLEWCQRHGFAAEPDLVLCSLSHWSDDKTMRLADPELDHLAITYEDGTDGFGRWDVQLSSKSGAQLVFEVESCVAIRVREEGGTEVPRHVLLGRVVQALRRQNAYALGITFSDSG